MPRSYGQCSPGGPIEVTHVPVPKVSLNREGSDIVSRMGARKERVSPMGPLPTVEQIREAEAKATRKPNISRKGVGRRLDHDEIVRLYVLEGWTAPRIARHLGCTPTPVYKALDGAGVQRRDGRKHR